MSAAFFQLTPIPATQMLGTYDYKLVFLSYLIAVLASFVALDFVGRLRAEKSAAAQAYWLVGGAFAMGTGIWSMHFIGMLAFVMPMNMGYSFGWTALSLASALLASGFALYLLRDKKLKASYILSGGVLIGLGIATMHYMGMQAMTKYATVSYLPGLFLLSIVIAIVASEAALWLALKSNEGSVRKQFNLKMVSALIMGIAICGMHYTGMAAAVFMPIPNHVMEGESIPPDLLAIFVAGITCLIISLALTVSNYYKNMIAAVQNEKDFLNAMLDNLEDGIIACDSAGNVTVLNDALQNNMQLMTGELNDKYKTLQLYAENSSTPVPENELPLARALAGETVHAAEYSLVLKEGLRREVIIDGQPIRNAQGKKLGAVIAIHDVTEIKKSEKMKREFVSIVSHELRTPLTSIRGTLGLLSGGMAGELSDRANHLLTIANKNCERLLLLINDILDLEKLQANKMQFDLKALDITRLVNEALAMNKGYAEKFDVKLQLGQGVSDVAVYSDECRLLQVLANLISNAIKFSKAGNAVTLDVIRNHNQVRVAVVDKGQGIPLEFQSRIFEKFSQADSSDARNQCGTGLGLSISKSLIEKMGGHINFKSVPNQGSTFYFDLPIYLANPRSNVSTPAMCLVCSNGEPAKKISKLLEKENFNVDIAQTINQAREMLKEKTYQALLLNLMQPEEDGISFIRELRNDSKTMDLPIIVLSLQPKPECEISGNAVVVLDWLDNPANYHKLIPALERLKPHQSNVLKKPAILHVEDDLDTQQVVASVLENRAAITNASTIHEAVRKLGQMTFDLVILDLLLPDGNGSDLLPIFSKYQLPIVVYSAFDLDSEYAKYASEALVKSKISNEEFIQSIERLLKETIKDDQYVE